MTHRSARLIAASAGKWADWLALLALSLYAGRYLAGSSLLHTLDGPTHAYRVLEFHRALLAGGLSPRWAPDLVFGYGYPLFNFYAPLTYYLTELLYRLGADPLLSVNLVSLLSLAAAGWCMYAFARTYLPRPVSFVAAVAYVYWPYRLAMLYVRGDVPELLAFALLPLLLFFCRRLIDSGQYRHLCGLALTMAVMVLTHNLTALLSAAVLVGYAGFTTLWEWRRIPWRVAAGLGAGIGLTGFFWMPATLETGWLDATRIFAADYRAKLVGFLDLLTPFTWDYHYYPNPDNLRTPFPLGFAVAVLIVLGVAATILIRHSARRGQGLFVFSGLLVAVSLVGLLDYFAPILEPLRLLQAPYRLLGFTAVGAAPLIAGMVLPFASRRWAWMVVAVLSLFLVLSATYRLSPYSDQPAPADFTVRGMMYREQVGGDIGTTWLGEFLPKWMREDPAQLVQPAPATGEAAPPAPLLVEVERWEPLRRMLRVVTLSEQVVSFHTFYYPSWRAAVDGQPVEALAVDRAGLLGVRVPAGSHRVEVWMAATPAAQVGTAVSWLSALALLAGWLVVHRVRVRLVTFGRGVWSVIERQRGVVVAVILALAAIGLLWLRFRPCPYASPLPPAPIGVTYGDEVMLAAAEWPREPALPGQTLPLTLYWLALINPQDVSAFVHLLTLDGETVAQADGVPLYGFSPTSRWIPGEVVADERALELPDAIPAGTYLIQAGVVSASDGRRLPVSSTSGSDERLRDDGVIVGKVIVGTEPTPPSDVTVMHADFGDKIALLASSTEPSVHPGGSLPVKLWWYVLQPMETDYTVFAHVVDGSGRVVAQKDAQPHDGRYPTSWWDGDETVPDELAVPIPSDTPAGTYNVELGMYDLRTMQRLPVDGTDHVVLGTVQVTGR